jgi:diadenosine tetraphosphatase ApaH/serine/threonine PP2A family protein phosphatase
MVFLVMQVKHKFNGLMLDVFREVFNWLPLAFVLNRKVLVLHGGLFSKDGVTLDDLRKVERNRCAYKVCFCAQHSMLCRRLCGLCGVCCGVVAAALGNV